MEQKIVITKAGKIKPSKCVQDLIDKWGVSKVVEVIFGCCKTSSLERPFRNLDSRNKYK